MKKYLTFENVIESIAVVVIAAFAVVLGVFFYQMSEPPTTVSHCVVNSTSTEFVKVRSYWVETTCGKFETDSNYNGMQVNHTYTITHSGFDEVEKWVEES